MYQRIPAASSGLGIAPLVIALPMVGAAGVGIWKLGEWGVRWISPYARAAGQATGLVSDPEMRPAPAPQFQPPPAPQTEAKLRTWNMEDLAEASAQRAVQYRADTDYLREVVASARNESGSGPGGAGDSWLMWAAIAAVGVGAILLVRR